MAWLRALRRPAELSESEGEATELDCFRRGRPRHNVMLAGACVSAACSDSKATSRSAEGGVGVGLDACLSSAVYESEMERW